MKILIIGGTGGTGKELIQQALESGHDVSALVRRPEKVGILNEHLRIIQGNVLNKDDVFNAVAGQDAVLSALGHKKFIIPTTILSDGTRNIIQAMELHGVKRLICITSLGVGDSRFKLGIYYTLFLIPLLLFFYFLDKTRQEKLIKSSHLDWTIVRPTQLFNGKLRGRYKAGIHVGNYFLTLLISRADVAHFMLSQLTRTTWLHKTPGIAF